jgi:hypothetical protein
LRTLGKQFLEEQRILFKLRQSGLFRNGWGIVTAMPASFASVQAFFPTDCINPSEDAGKSNQ